MKRAASRQGVLSLLGLGALAIVLAAGYFAYIQATRAFLDDTARRGDNTLQLVTTTLNGQMARFERLPLLIADHALIRAIARAPLNPEVIDLANSFLRDTQQLLGASDIYFMDTAGITRVASNFDQPASFVGGDFSFRPYFKDAVSGGQGRFFALGTTSGKRGYYFSAAVRVQGRIAGVLVVKVDLDAAEDAWRGGEDVLLVTDPDGVVFLSSRPEWLFTTLAALTPDQQAALAANRRYDAVSLKEFPVTAEVQDNRHRLLSVRQGPTYLVLNRLMPEAGWTVRVLLETASARRQAMTVAIVVMLGLGLGVMALAVVLQRRARLRERLFLQQAARNQLERRVAERTFELAGVNQRLEAEVAERRQAEQNLRQAQDDLIQAGKLAALGQMSASLSHEYAQPLAAARNYAENAVVFLDRGQPDEARGNIGRILSLIERMASIAKHLRSFARAPGQKLSVVCLPDVAEAAAEIAQLRLKAAGATLRVTLPEGLPKVIAGPVRLQQVLVNLLTNAADAVEVSDNREVELRAEQVGDTVLLSVLDHGPGVPPDLAARIFDPFFSTKGVGRGLGLGLSISYNIVRDFGGNLTVGANEGGGAVFRIVLQTAENPVA